MFGSALNFLRQRLSVRMTAFRTARQPLCRSEPSADLRRYSQNLQNARSHRTALHLLRHSCLRQIHRPAHAQGAHRFKRVVVQCPIRVLRVRHGVVVQVRVKLTSPNQPPRITIGKRLQQHSIHHAENRRVRPNPQRQRQNRRRRKSRILPQHPRPKFQIPDKILQPPPPPSLPPPLTHRHPIPKRPRRRIPRLNPLFFAQLFGTRHAFTRFCDGSVCLHLARRLRHQSALCAAVNATRPRGCGQQLSLSRLAMQPHLFVHLARQLVAPH